MEMYETQKIVKSLENEARMYYGLRPKLPLGITPAATSIDTTIGALNNEARALQGMGRIGRVGVARAGRYDSQDYKVLQTEAEYLLSLVGKN
jgi:hypothetical protein